MTAGRRESIRQGDLVRGPKDPRRITKVMCAAHAIHLHMCSTATRCSMSKVVGLTLTLDGVGMPGMKEIAGTMNAKLAVVHIIALLAPSTSSTNATVRKSNNSWNRTRSALRKRARLPARKSRELHLQLQPVIRGVKRGRIRNLLFSQRRPLREPVLRVLRRNRPRRTNFQVVK